MKLLRCYIENFGKLHKFKYEFTDGLNTIKEDNGFGKTTFASFIKSMFYGLDASARAGDSDRKTYKPWQGGNFGGNIEFELNGKSYRVERFFGNKASEDTFALYNLATNLESYDFSENIGEEIFKINKEAYERSTYIPQGKILTQMDDSISAKLGNVLESENDVNTSEEAIKLLKDAMKFYVKTGGKGAINEKKTELNKLQRNLENTKFDEENLEIRLKRLEEINQEIKQKQDLKNEKQKLLTKKLEQEKNNAKQETYKNILENVNKNEAEFNELKNFFKAGVPEDIEIEDVLNKYSEVEKLKVEISNNILFGEEKVQLDRLKNKFDEKSVSEGEIDQKILACSKLREIENEIQNTKESIERISDEVKIEENNRKKAKQKKLILMIIGIIFIILGVVLGFINIVISIVLGIMGIALLVVSFLGRDTKTSKSNFELEKMKNLLGELESNKAIAEFKINQFIESYTSAIERNTVQNDKILILSNLKTEYSKYKELLSKNQSKEKTNNLAVANKNKLENEIRIFMEQYFANLDGSFIDFIQKLRINKNKFLELEKELENAYKIKEEYEKNNEVHLKEDVKEIEDIDENALTQEIKNLSLKIDEALDIKNQLKNQIELLKNKIDDNEYLQADIENLKEEIEEYEAKYKTLQKTKDLLEQAKENFSATYLKGMVEGFEKYLSLIENTGIETNVDINLNVKIDVDGAKKEVKSFSAGYQDLIYICIRFGLINALFKDEKPYVVLDDPFVNLDDIKTENAIKLLEELSKEYQIIYFVCNTSRTNVK